MFSQCWASLTEAEFQSHGQHINTLTAAGLHTGPGPGPGLTGRADHKDLRQNGRQGEELGGQVGQVDQQEDKQRLDDPNLLGETSDEAKDDGKHQTHQSPPDTDDEEGGCREGGGGGRGGGKRREGGRGEGRGKEGE